MGELSCARIVSIEKISQVCAWLYKHPSQGDEDPYSSPRNLHELRMNAPPDVTSDVTAPWLTSLAGCAAGFQGQGRFCVINYWDHHTKLVDISCSNVGSRATQTCFYGNWLLSFKQIKSLTTVHAYLRMFFPLAVVTNAVSWMPPNADMPRPQNILLH